MTETKPNAPSRPLARSPRGFIDRRADALLAERSVVEKVLRVYESWGYERLETPSFEYADALGKFLPDQDRPNEGVFALEDDDGQWMSLRYDLTAPLARFAAQNWDSLPKPFRRCAAGPVWRNEKPGPGRYREFWQCDADCVGSARPEADAEAIAMGAAAVEAAGVPRGLYVVNVSNRKLLDGLLAKIGVDVADTATRLGVLRAVDKLDRLGPEGVELLLGAGRKDESGDFTKGAGLGSNAIAQVLAFTSTRKTTRLETLNALDAVVGDTELGAEGVAELGAIDATLRALAILEDRAFFDPAIVRGLEYYTGPVFEAELLTETLDEKGNKVRFGSIGSGGRYDDLVMRFRGERAPATGFSLGVSRLVAALSASGRPPEAAQGPVVILALDGDAMVGYMQMAGELRAAGIAAEVYLGSSGMKAQMKYADRRKAPVVVMEGSQEREAGKVTLKDLKLGAQLAQAIESNEAWRRERPAQVEVPRAQLVEAVQDMLQP
ncbi:MAG: histidine--tRNA ligase [Hyphomonadaceae bacterium]